MRVLQNLGAGVARHLDAQDDSISARVFVQVLLVLGAIDAVLIGIYVGYGIALVDEPGAAVPHLLDITKDWSAGEIASYGKWMVAALALAAAWRQRRLPLLLAFAVVVLVLLLDDMLRLHERFGSVVAAELGLAERIGPLRSQDVGEVLIWGLLGLPVALALVWGFVATPAGRRGLGVIFVALLALLVAVGGLVDLVAVAFDLALDGVGARIASGVANVVEDGGEMLLASAICALAVAVLAGSPEPRALPEASRAPGRAPGSAGASPGRRAAVAESRLVGDARGR